MLLSLFPVALDVLQAAKEVAETMLKGEAPDDKERLVVTATVAAPFLEEGEEEVDVTPRIFPKKREDTPHEALLHEEKEEEEEEEEIVLLSADCAPVVDDVLPMRVVVLGEALKKRNIVFFYCSERGEERQKRTNKILREEFYVPKNSRERNSKSTQNRTQISYQISARSFLSSASGGSIREKGRETTCPLKIRNKKSYPTKA